MDGNAGMLAAPFERSMGLGGEWAVTEVWTEEPEGGLNWFSSRSTNAFLEGVNSVAQSIKRAARGFRNLEYFETMMFLRLGGLDFSAQTSQLHATH